MLPEPPTPQNVEELIEIVLLTFAREHKVPREMVPFEIEAVVRRAIQAAYRAGKVEDNPAGSRFSSATIKALQIPRMPSLKIYRQSKRPMFPVVDDDEDDE